MSREGTTARRVLAVATAAIAVALAALLAPGALGKGSKPHASLRVSDRVATVGERVVFDSSRSRGDIAYHLWDLNGDNEYETSTHRRARVSRVFDRTGTMRVAVAVFDHHGGYDVQRATLRVVARSAPRPQPVASGPRKHGVRTATKDRKKRSKGGGHAKPKAKTSSDDRSPALRAAAAATSSVTIKDFEFVPKEITVSVGTTVTWTNDGPTAHSATADDGTFDTGTLVKGQSGQYKFTKAGTYKYHCTPHPYMHGTVVVTGSGGSAAPNDSNSSSNNGNNGGSSSKNKSNLPLTGLRIAFFVLVGLALVGGGYGLRRQVRGH